MMPTDSLLDIKLNKFLKLAVRHKVLQYWIYVILKRYKGPQNQNKTPMKTKMISTLKITLSSTPNSFSLNENVISKEVHIFHKT